MTKKGNLGNVAMGLCLICKKPAVILLQNREGKDAFDGKQSIQTNEICNECQKTMDENVCLYCDTCNGFMVLKAGALEGTKAGDKYRIHKCEHCTGTPGQIQFRPDNYVEDEPTEGTESTKS